MHSSTVGGGAPLAGDATPDTEDAARAVAADSLGDGVATLLGGGAADSLGDGAADSLGDGTADSLLCDGDASAS